MKFRALLPLLVVVAGALVGCRSMAEVHTGVADELNMTYMDLAVVQYYLDEPLTLEIEKIQAVSGVTKQRTVYSQLESVVREIVIPKGTPARADVFSLDEVQLRVAVDLVLGFKPAVWSLAPAVRDSLGLSDELLGELRADSLALDTLRLDPSKIAALDLAIPYELVTVNDQPILPDSLVTFRDQTYRVRFGFYGRGREWVERPPPGIRYEREVNAQHVRQTELIQGIRVSSAGDEGDPNGGR